MAIVAQQQTDPEKAKISSIWEVKDTTKKEPMQTSTPASPVTEMKIDAPKSINPTTGEMFNADWTAYTWTLPQVKAWSYYRDVYLPKVQAEKLKKQWQVQNIETPAPTKAQTMDTNTLSVAYEMWDVSATDLENLKQTDPLKYQEAKLAIERKRTLDAINQTWSSYLTTQKQLFDSYIQKWDEISWSDEWKTLREEVFAKYGLDKSNEKIQQYSTQIDEVDAELESLSDWTGTGDALADRGEIISRTKALTKQRNDLVKLRANEMDYYRLGLEQADAVAADYKEYKAQELAQLGVRFEMMTGMSKMEFEMKDKQNRDYLADVDKSIGGVQEEIKAQQKTESDRFYAWSLLSLYDEFSDESKAVLSNLPPERLEAVLKTYADKTKQAEDKYYKELDYKYKDKEMELKQKEFEQKRKEAAQKNVEVVKLDDWSIILVNKETWETGQIYQTPSSSPIKFNEPEINSIVDFCINNRWWRTNIQCGELVNDYWTKQMWYKIGMQDSYESKVKAIQWAWQSPTPMAWGVFAFPWGDHWHTGIVTKVFEDWSIEVLEANRGWTDKWSYPEINTYSASKVKSMVFSMPPATWEEYSVDFNAIELPKDAKESQIKSLTFANRMRDAHEKLLTLWLEDVFVWRSWAWQVRESNTFDIFKSTSQKDLEALKQSFISWVLRSESWSAITDTEFARYEKMYFPLPWDSLDTLKKKQAMREEAIKWMYIQAWNDKSKTRIADYYDPTTFSSRIEKLNTPKTVYQDEVDNELAQYWIGIGILNTIPSFN